MVRKIRRKNIIEKKKLEAEKIDQKTQNVLVLDLGKSVDNIFRKQEISPEINALIQKANSYLKKGEDLNAYVCFHDVIRKDPKNVIAIHNLGKVCWKRKEPEQSIRYFEEVIRINPYFFKSYNDLIFVAKKCYKWNLVIDTYKKLLEIKENDSKVLDSYASDLMLMGKHKEAIEILNKLKEQNKLKEPSKLKLAKSYKAVEEHSKAVEILEELTAKESSVQNEASWLLSKHYINDPEKLEEGLNLYEEGLKNNFRKVEYLDNVASWHGEDNKNIALLKEQGFDDILFHAANYNKVIEKSKKVIIETDPLFYNLFKRTFENAEIVEKIDDDSIDYQIASGSLNKLFYDLNKKIDLQEQYLKPDCLRAGYWERIFNKISDKPKIGLYWRKEDATVLDKNKYLEIYDFKSLSDIQKIKDNDVNFINLQSDNNYAETAILGDKYGISVKTIHTNIDIDPIDDAVALMHNIDLVISVRGAVPFMASALGVETWILDVTHTDEDNLERLPLDSPNVRRFVKRKNQTWEDLINEKVKPALEKRLNEPFYKRELQQVAVLDDEKFDKIVSKIFGDTKKQTSFSVFNLLKEEIALLNVKDTKKIIDIFLKKYPDYGEALYFLGKVAFFEKKYDEAKNYISRAYEINSGIKGLNFDRSYFFDADDDQNGDVEILEDKNIDVQSNEYLLDDAKKYLKEEKNFEALKALERLYNIGFDNKEFLKLYIKVLFLYNSKDKIIEICSEALENNPNDMELQEFLFKAKFIKNGLAKALEEPLVQVSCEEPLWNGEDISDKKLLVIKSALKENEILFANFYKFALSSAKKVVFETNKSSKTFLEENFGKGVFVSTDNLDNNKQDVDIAVSADNLMYLFYKKEKNIKFSPKYLQPISEQIVYWKRYLNKIDKQFRIGIYYNNSEDNLENYINPDNLQELIKLSGLTFVNLGNGKINGIHNIEINLLENYRNAAALLANFDCIITVPGVIANISAAIGIETLIVQNGQYNDEEQENIKQLYPKNADLILKSPKVKWEDFINDVIVKRIEQHFKFKHAIRITNQNRLELNKPHTVNELYQRAFALRNNKEFKDAKIILNAILDVKPNQKETLLLYADIARTEEDFVKAEECYRKVLEKLPDNIDAVSGLAISCVQQEKFDEIPELVERILVSNTPKCIHYHTLASLLVDAGRFAEARDLLEKCLELNPDHHETLVNLSSPYLYLGQVKAAKDTLKKAQTQNRANIKATWNLAMRLVHYKEEQEEGLKYYEDGLETKKRLPTRTFSVPRWDGLDVSDKKLLIWREQGIGDELAFAAYFKYAIKQAKECVLEVNPRLVALFKRSFKDATVLPQPKRMEKKDIYRKDIDVHCPAASVRYFYYQKYKCLDNYEPFLVPEEQAKEKWKKQLDQISSKPKVGICWRSGYLTALRSNFYAKIEDYIELFKNEDVDFVNLQYDDCQEELDKIEELCGRKIHNLEGIDLKMQIDEVVALMSNLDLVISAQTAVDEMANGLGLPTWSVTRMINETLPVFTNSPLYPSNRYFFQRPASIAWKELSNEYIVPQFNEFIKNLKK